MPDEFAALIKHERFENHKTMRTFYHANIIRTVTNCKRSCIHMFLHQFNDQCLEYQEQQSNLIMNTSVHQRVHLNLLMSGRALVNILIGMLVSFFGFKTYQNAFFCFSNLHHSIVAEKLRSFFGFSENLHHFWDKTDGYWGSRIILSFFRVWNFGPAIFRLSRFLVWDLFG